MSADLAEGLKTMENLVALFSPPTCANCGRTLVGKPRTLGQPVANIFTGDDEDDLCDAICRRDYREHYT